jgi:selenocysteine lyase/cysteine desulfurase
VEPYLPDEAKLSVFRDALPATSAGIYLDTLTAGPLPAETARAMEEADGWDLRTGRAGVDRASDLLQRMEEARGVLAALVGADPDDILLTNGVRDALAIAEALAGDRGVRVIQHVDATTGAAATLDPTPGTSRQGALVVLDAGSSAGVLPIAARELGVAFVALAGQRWLLGPEGTGALWVDRAQVPHTPPGPMRPGADLLPRRSVLGLARSVGWLEMYIGLPWIHERTARLAAALRAELAATAGVTMLTPEGCRTGIVSFRIAGWPAQAAADELGSRVFAILGAPPSEDVLRLSFGAFNTEQELTRLTQTVELLARHTPDTLPRRPSLVMLSSVEG